jgi:hypothetical protein
LILRKSASLSHAARAFLKVAQAIAAQRQGNYRFERESKTRRDAPLTEEPE